MKSKLASLLLVALTALSLSCTSPAPEPDPVPAKKLNIVVLVFDALRAGNLGFMGYDRPTSPNLDALANESYVFDQAIAAGGNTPTTMSAIMTGRYPYFTFEEGWDSPFGMRRFYADAQELGLPESLDTLAERLQAAGYTTAGFITNPYLKKEFNFHQGFDHYEEIFRDGGIPYGLGETVSAQAESYLRDLTAANGDATDGDKPFFLYLHYMDTHGPYAPPLEYRTQFDPEGVDRFDNERWTRWEDEIDLQADDADGLRQEILNLYDGAVAYTDESAGRFLNALQEMGLTEDTLIVVTADHGDEFLEHGRTTHKGTLYEELVHIPFLFRIPGRPGGRIGDLVRNSDLMPTLFGLVGLETPTDIDTVSLRPLIDGEAQSLRLAAYAAFPNVRMLRTPRYKFLHYGKANRFEMYDLQEDPAEKKNIVADPEHAERLASLQGALERIVSSLQEGQPLDAPAPAAMDDKTREQLRALGYLD